MFKSIDSKLVGVVVKNYKVGAKELVIETMMVLNNSTMPPFPSAASLCLATMAREARTAQEARKTVAKPVSAPETKRDPNKIVAEFFKSCGGLYDEARQAHYIMTGKVAGVGQTKFRLVMSSLSREFGVEGTKAYVRGALAYGLVITQDGRSIESDDIGMGLIHHSYVQTIARCEQEVSEDYWGTPCDDEPQCLEVAADPCFECEA
ncbi:MAG: hypothetical protein NTY41_11210 [Proteobacteria bacterium]|nr:hypothetical protein [Pseudomonadota bacterium]